MRHTLQTRTHFTTRYDTCTCTAAMPHAFALHRAPLPAAATPTRVSRTARACFAPRTPAGLRTACAPAAHTPAPPPCTTSPGCHARTTAHPHAPRYHLSHYTPPLRTHLHCHTTSRCLCLHSLPQLPAPAYLPHPAHLHALPAARCTGGTLHCLHAGTATSLPHLPTALPHAALPALRGHGLPLPHMVLPLPTSHARPTTSAAHTHTPHTLRLPPHCHHTAPALQFYTTMPAHTFCHAPFLCHIGTATPLRATHRYLPALVCPTPLPCALPCTARRTFTCYIPLVWFTYCLTFPTRLPFTWTRLPEKKKKKREEDAAHA